MPARSHRATTVRRRFLRATSTSRPNFSSDRAIRGGREEEEEEEEEVVSRIASRKRAINCHFVSYTSRYINPRVTPRGGIPPLVRCFDDNVSHTILYNDYCIVYEAQDYESRTADRQASNPQVGVTAREALENAL